MHRTAWSSPDEVRPPLGAQAVQWAVYRLRERGAKLEPPQVLATRRDGWLRMRTWGDSLRVTLYHQHGPTFERSAVNEIATLEDARVVRMVEGGMLLHGRQLHIDKLDMAALPQAWWCVLVSVAPWPFTVPPQEKAPPGANPAGQHGFP